MGRSKGLLKGRGREGNELLFHKPSSTTQLSPRVQQPTFQNSFLPPSTQENLHLLSSPPPPTPSTLLPPVTFNSASVVDTPHSLLSSRSLIRRRLRFGDFEQPPASQPRILYSRGIHIISGPSKQFTLYSFGIQHLPALPLATSLCPLVLREH